MCQGLSHSYHGLLVVRFLMGIVETGLPSGASFIIASYYRKKESALRFAIYLAFGEAGSCFSGVSLLFYYPELHTNYTQLLAYAIQGMNGTAGMGGWRW